jgi:arylsulfatase A-like enzyme
MSRGFDEFYGFLGGEHSYFESSPNGGNPLYEGRTRVEASGYLTVARGRVDSRPIIQLDVLPAALGAAGVEAKPEWKLDRVNLLPYLTGKFQPAPHEALYWRLFAHMAIRKRPWKPQPVPRK